MYKGPNFSRMEVQHLVQGFFGNISLLGELKKYDVKVIDLITQSGLEQIPKWILSQLKAKFGPNSTTADLAGKFDDSLLNEGKTLTIKNNGIFLHVRARVECERALCAYASLFIAFCSCFYSFFGARYIPISQHLYFTPKRFPSLIAKDELAL